MLKKLFCFSSIAIILGMATLPVGMTSCTKTNTDTVVVVKKDTLQEKDTALTAAILTANSWKVQYDRATSGGTMFFYSRGGSSNTMDLTNESITFNANNTGKYIDPTGIQTTFTWNFTDATNTKISWLWNLPTPTSVIWENLSYDDGALHYTEYYVYGGNTVLSTIIRIPK